MHERKQVAITAAHAARRRADEEALRLRDARRGLEGPRLITAKKKQREAKEKLETAEAQLALQKRVVGALENELDVLANANEISLSL